MANARDVTIYLSIFPIPGWPASAGPRAPAGVVCVLVGCPPRPSRGERARAVSYPSFLLLLGLLVSARVRAAGQALNEYRFGVCECL